MNASTASGRKESSASHIRVEVGEGRHPTLKGLRNEHNVREWQSCLLIPAMVAETIYAKEDCAAVSEPLRSCRCASLDTLPKDTPERPGVRGLVAQ